MSNALTLPSISSLDSLDQYLRTIKTFPVLSAEEERDLATRYRADNDLDAAKGLIISHLRLVASIARGFRIVAWSSFAHRKYASFTRSSATACRPVIFVPSASRKARCSSNCANACSFMIKAI